jgi:hypothetical protein
MKEIRHSAFAPEVVRSSHSDLEVSYAEHTRDVSAQVVGEHVPMQVFENPFADPEPALTPRHPSLEQEREGRGRSSFTAISLDDTDTNLLKNKVPKNSRFRDRKLFCCFCTPRTFCIVLLVSSVTFILTLVLVATTLSLRPTHGANAGNTESGNSPGTTRVNGTNVAQVQNSTQVLLSNITADVAAGIGGGKGGRNRKLI